MLLKMLSVAVFFFSLDQFTKMLIARRLAEGQSVSVSSWIRIRRVDNVRGMLLSNPRVLPLVLAALFGGIGLIVTQGYFFQHRAAQIGLGMALGGAGSNVYDQLRRGAVIDFLDLGWWPVFNLADVAITVGVIMALWFFLILAPPKNYPANTQLPPATVHKKLKPDIISNLNSKESRWRHILTMVSEGIYCPRRC